MKIEKMINAIFNFHPVGQGCFYTGIIEESRSSNHFNMVYDCGVLYDKSYLNNNINSFNNYLQIKKENLNVLFLSHLDNDHVNGVTNLLFGIKCEKIYLPYLTPIQRLFVAIKCEPDIDSDKDFMNFLQSPHQYLFNNNNIDEIIYILGNSDDTLSLENNDKNPEFVLHDKLDPISDDSSSEINDIINIFKDKVKFRKGNRTITLSNIWEFYLYYKPSDITKITALIKYIESTFQFKISGQLTQIQLFDILNNEKMFKKLKEEFKKYFGDLNTPSMLLLHKPLNYRNAKIIKERQSFPVFKNFKKRIGKIFIIKNGLQNNYRNQKVVTLLTGDIGLDQICESSYIKSHLIMVMVFQVPHHGSETGWDKNKLTELNNQKVSTIINFGFGNTFGHPRPNVLNDLIVNQLEINFCNQFVDFEYCIKLYR